VVAIRAGYGSAPRRTTRGVERGVVSYKMTPERAIRVSCRPASRDMPCDTRYCPV
jgi:hypothetical protein